MKKAFLLIPLLLHPSNLILGKSDPAAQEMLTVAGKQANVFDEGVAPFQMDVDFVAQIEIPVQGHMTLKWGSKDRWWRKIVLGNFEEIDVRSGDRLYISRNGGFTPLRVGELLGLIHFADSYKDFHVKSQKQRSENGIQMSCLQVEGENVPGKSNEVCLNSSSREILLDKWNEPPDEHRLERFSEYFNFLEQRYPRKLDLLVDGIKAISAHVDGIASVTLEDISLIAPKGSIERRQCADMKRAVPIKTPDPMYPKSASQNRMMGDTTVSMTVLVDGSVTDIQLIGSAARSMDEATLTTLKGWKFKAAMCGTEPVVSDVEVVVSFRLD
jgi:TonB family protein